MSGDQRQHEPWCPINNVPSGPGFQPVYGPMCTCGDRGRMPDLEDDQPDGSALLEEARSAPPAFGDWLRQRREEKRLTLRAMADRMGVTAPFLSDVEHGRRNLTGRRLGDAAMALGLPVEELETARADVDAELRRWIAEHPRLVRWLRSLKARQEGGR